MKFKSKPNISQIKVKKQSLLHRMFWRPEKGAWRMRDAFRSPMEGARHTFAA